MNSNKNKAPSSRLRLGRIFRLARKELLEIMRDRRTIITLVLMPLIVYPLLGIVVQKLMLQTLTGTSEVTYSVGLESTQDLEAFASLFRRGEQIVQRQMENKRHSGSEESEPGQTQADPVAMIATRANVTSDGSDGKPIKTEFFIAGDKPLSDLVRANFFDLGVVRQIDQEGGTAHYELLHAPDSAYSQRALHHVGRRLRLAHNEMTQQLVQMGGLKGSVPGAYVQTAVIGEQVERQPVLLTFLPLMLVLMTITGAVYPAIDLTAGERERGTMEILVAAPIPRLALLVGKFVAVLAVAMLTALVNLLAMVISIYSLGLDNVIFGSGGGISVVTVLLIFVLLFVLAAFFSATLLALTSFARSFKEAQAYLIPLMLVAFAPGLLSLTPNLETSSLLAIIPLVNVVLVGRDLLAGEANFVLVLVTIVATFFYGLLALSAAARVFGADSILTGGKSTWSDVLRAPEQQSQPSIFHALFFLSILFPSFVVLAGLTSNFAGKMDATLEQRLWANAVVTAVLFVGLPVGFAVVLRLSKRTTFFWQRPRWSSLFAAVLLGISMWTLAYEVEVLSLSSARVQEFLKLFAGMKLGLAEVPLVVKLICLAAAPAICEELTFRGFLLSAFLKRMPAFYAVLVTGLLFGLFHVFVRDALLFERMLPSTLMGILLGYVCIKTGSILPGMLLHVIHNGLLISLAHYEQALAKWDIGFVDQSHLPVSWLAIAFVPIAIGMMVLFYSRPGHTQHTYAAAPASDQDG